MLDEITSVQSIVQGGVEGQPVIVHGWLQNKRSGGGIVFLLVRDGTGVVQCTARKEKVPTALFDQLLSARVESAVELKGIASRDPRAPGGWEIKVESGKIQSAALEDFPIAKKLHGREFHLEKSNL